MVCDVCNDALEHRRNRIRYLEYIGGDFGHHRTVSSLEDSVDAKCWLCLIIWQNTPKADWDRMRFARNVTPLEGFTKINQDFITVFKIQYLNEDEPGVAKIEVQQYGLDSHSEKGPASLMSFQLFKDSETIYKLDGPTAEEFEADATSSTRSLRTATQWLRNCFDTHKSCRVRTQDSKWYPTRLLDLGLGDLEDDVRLILSTEAKPVGFYATLSHCWEGLKPLQLTNDSLKQHLEGIALVDMPWTFRDAVLVTRKLRVRYLWIDSLCILQGDRADWQIEASLMHAVCSNSYCSFSATWAKNGTQGLFRQLKTTALSLEPISVSWAAPTSIKEVKHVRQCIAFELESQRWQDNVTLSPVNRRAWVLQERLLSPRVLHFCQGQIFWECRSQSASEEFPKSPIHTYMDGGSKFKDNAEYFEYVEKARSRALESWEKEAAFEAWQNIVVVYSKTSLTVATDKLIALSGIATSMLVLLGTHVAGLWRESLERQLSWAAITETDSSPCSSIPSDYCAPTWSWASIQGPIQFVACSDLIEYQVVDVELQFTTDDTTGQVLSGYLDLCGLLRSFVFTVISDTSTVYTLDVIKGPMQGNAMACFDESPINLALIMDDCAQARLYSMNIGSEKSDRSALMLRVVDVHKGIFERIGLMNWTITEGDWNGGEPALNHDIGGDQEVESAQLQALPYLRYENGQHTIRVI